MQYKDQAFYGEFLPERDPVYKTKQRNNLSRIGFALLAFLLLSGFVQAAMQIAVEWLAPAFSETSLFDWLLAILPGYGVGFPFFVLFLVGMPKKAPQKQRLTKEDALMYFCIAFLLMMVGNFLSVTLMGMFESLRGTEIPNALEGYLEEYSPLMSFVVMVVLAPIFEELMFRKLIMDRLLPYSETLAVVTSGIFFGLVHGNFYQFFYAAFLGMFFGWIYLKTGKLRHTILLHAIINFTGSTIATFMAEVTAEDAMLESSINPWVTISGVYSTALFLLAACGLIFIIRKRKNFRLAKIGDRYLTLGTQFKLAWGNVGTIVFCAVCVLLFIMSLFLS